jgi:hypothetical protein
MHSARLCPTPTAAADRPGGGALAKNAPHKNKTQADGLAVTWDQNQDEVFLKVPVAEGVKGRDVAFEVHPGRLSLALGGDVLLAGSLADAGEIDVDGDYDYLVRIEHTLESTTFVVVVAA